MTPEPKRKGRPPGSGLGVPLGARLGSRRWTLERLTPGQSALFEVPEDGTPAASMSALTTDIHRAGLAGRVSLSLVHGIVPGSPRVLYIIRATRGEE